MIIPRDLKSKLQQLANQFPAIAVLGPRQSGKTTLVQTTFKEYAYFSFEEPDIRAIARTDPRAFLEKYKDEQGVIFDEIQHVPDLMSYMQTHIDRYKKKGYFILTGSQNLLVNQSISQSLAGRIAVLTLLPLSIHELQSAHRWQLLN
jgi:predicted AAA+ superfamily ATPase